MAAEQRKPLDAYAAVSFYLAVFLMILPFEADIVFVGLNSGNVASAALVAAACSIAVLAPLLLSARRRRIQPYQWRGGGYFAGAAAILVLQLLVMGSVFYRVFQAG